MATFYDYLQTIQTAVYGKDVRAAMAQALESVYEHSGTQQFDLKMDKANPTGTGAISVNRKANTTTGQLSVSLGSNNEASGNHSVSLGYHCQATGGSSFAMGNECKSLGTATVALGLQNIAENTSGNTPGQTAVGRFNAADSDAMFIVGNGYESGGEIYRRNAFVVKGHGSVSAGWHTEAYDSNSSAYGQFVCGKFNDLETSALFVVGNGSDDSNRSNALTVLANGKIAAGSGVFPTSPLTIGKYNETSAALFTVGDGTSDSNRSNALEVFDGGSFSVGKDNSVHYTGDTRDTIKMAIGTGNSIHGSHSYALGDNANLQADNNISIGYDNVTDSRYQNVVMLGKELENDSSNVCIVGQYNYPHGITNPYGDPVFVVGNGTGEVHDDVIDRKNGLVVFDNGDTYIYGHLYCIIDGVKREVALS